MIIRMNYGDNDFCGEIESFCSGLRDRMFVFNEEDPIFLEFSSAEEKLKACLRFLERRRAADKRRAYLMNPDNHFKKNGREHRMIRDEVLRLWREFAHENDLECLEPHVSVQYSLDEKWENAEVAYYFTAYDKCIIQ